MDEKYKFFLFIPLFILIVAGCGSSLNVLKGPASFDKETEQQEETDEQLRQQYLGKSKEEIMEKFGKPIYADQDCQYNMYLDDINKKWVKGTADECVAFRFTSGIPIIHGDVWSVMFYFKDDRVVWVKVN